jgi:transcriptional regulator with XRE-family HTH domain
MKSGLAQKDGHTFRFWREHLGLSRKEAAERLGVHPSTISRIEKRKSLPVKRIEALGLKLTIVDKDGTESDPEEFFGVINERLGAMSEEELVEFALRMGLITENDLRKLRIPAIY